MRIYKTEMCTPSNIDSVLNDAVENIASDITIESTLYTGVLVALTYSYLKEAEWRWKVYVKRTVNLNSTDTLTAFVSKERWDSYYFGYDVHSEHDTPAAALEIADAINELAGETTPPIRT